MKVGRRPGEIRTASVIMRAVFERMDEQGLTQRDVAEWAGVGQGRLSEYRRGMFTPSVTIAEALAEAVGLEIEVRVK